MRLRRICEKKALGKLQVDDATHKQWLEGNRDVLSLALVKALKKHGTENNKKVRDLVRQEFQAEVIKVREITEAREEELEGKWLTEERMLTEMKYSKRLCSIL